MNGGRGATPAIHFFVPRRHARQRHHTRAAMSEKSARSDRNVETRKKKARRVIPRAKVTRIQGNTPGARKRLKKLAAKRQNTAQKAG